MRTAPCADDNCTGIDARWCAIVILEFRASEISGTQGGAFCPGSRLSALGAPAGMTNDDRTKLPSLRHAVAARRPAPDPATGARAVPIYQTTSFVFDDTEHAAALFNMERAGHVYSRISNPTIAVLEERIAALEGGVGAIATASGQAALHLAIATLMGAGGAHRRLGALYGGSHNLLTTRCRASASTPPSSSRATSTAARGHPRQDAAAVRRDARQPGPRRARHPAVADDRARARPAAAGRFDLHHALPVPALRARRRPRLPLGHQVPRRPRHRDRRRAGRRRPLRLGRAAGKFPT